MTVRLQIKSTPIERFLTPGTDGTFTAAAAAGTGTLRIVIGGEFALNRRTKTDTPLAPTTAPLKSRLDVICRVKKDKLASTDGWVVCASFPGLTSFLKGISGIEPAFVADSTKAGFEKIINRIEPTVDLVTQSDFIFEVSGDKSTVTLPNDHGPVLIQLPWLFDIEHPLLQLSARLTVAGTLEADETLNAPLDIPQRFPRIADEGKAGASVFTFFGVRNLAVQSSERDPTGPKGAKQTAKVPKIGSATLRVFFHATFTDFCSRQTGGAAAVGGLIETILKDAGFASVKVATDASASTECAKLFREVDGRFMAVKIVDPDQSKPQGDRLEFKFAAHIAADPEKAPPFTVPDGMESKVPFFDFHVFAETREPPQNELARSEGGPTVHDVLIPTVEKLLYTPIVVCMGLTSNTPLRTLLAKIEPADAVNVLATTVAHEIGHSFGLHHAVTFDRTAAFTMGDPDGLQRTVMASAGIQNNPFGHVPPNPPEKAHSPLYFFGPIQKLTIKALFL